MSDNIMPALIMGGIVFILIGLPLGAVFLRAAVSCTNLIIGAKRTSNGTTLTEIPTPTGMLDDGSNPFAIPQTISLAVDRTGVDPIPEPSFGSACGIVLATGLLAAVVNWLANVLGRVGMVNPLTLQLINFAIGLGISTLTYKSMLPTSIGRALLVYVIQVGLAIVIFGSLAAFAVLVWRSAA